MGSIIGIDLGTTNSVLSILEGGKPVVITNAEGSRTTPSVVAYTEKEGILVGDMARRQSIINPKGTIYSIKRFMGRRYDETTAEERAAVPYETCDQLNGDIGVRIDGRIHSPAEISAEILRKFKGEAEKYLGHEVTEAIITVPAYFNDAQRRATQVAGEIAGLKVRRIINEPTAAALAYGVDKLDKNQKVAVYDFGGGTFDISILELGDGVIEVLATNGDAHLGGDDIDQLIVDDLVRQFEFSTGINVSKDILILQRLREAAEKAKKELSTMIETEIYLPFLTANETGPKHLQTKLSRARLEAMMAHLVDRSIDCCKRAFEDAKLKPSDVQEVLLVGGTTRVPAVQAAVEKFFGKAPNHSLNPDEVVSLGAAIQGGVLSGDVHDIVLLDVTPLTLGIKANGGLMVSLIERNTTIPVKRSKIFSTSADNQTTVAIDVYQGERKFAEQNRFLGKFELTDIEPAPRAVPKIDVTFEIDANGVLKVSATNEKTNKTESLVLMGAGGLSKDEIAQAIANAEAEAEKDEARKAIQVARNKIQSFMFSIDRMMRELSDRATEELINSTRPVLDEASVVSSNMDATQETLDAMLEKLSPLSRSWCDIRYAKEAEERAAEEAKKQQEAQAQAQQQAQQQQQ